MPRKVDIASSISPCTATVLWQAVYADPAPTAQYHSLVNQDPAAVVGAWKDGKRHITFQMPLQAPDWVKRTVGIDSVRVREQQVVVWHSTHSFSVRSETTVLNVPGASRFVTTLHLTVKEVADTQLTQQETVTGRSSATSASMCEITFTVCCTAGMPWPLSTSIENIMAERAQISMQGYLDYCHSLVNTYLPQAIDTRTGQQQSDSHLQRTAASRVSQPGVGPNLQPPQTTAAAHTQHRVTAAALLAAATSSTTHSSDRDITQTQGRSTTNANNSLVSDIPVAQVQEPMADSSNADSGTGGVMTSVRVAGSDVGEVAQGGVAAPGVSASGGSSVLAGLARQVQHPGFRWPSIAVSSFTQDVDHLMDPDDSLSLAIPGLSAAGAIPGLSAAGAIPGLSAAGAMPAGASGVGAGDRATPGMRATWHDSAAAGDRTGAGAGLGAAAGAGTGAGSGAGAGTGAGSGAGEGSGPEGGEDSFQDACQWLSPATSFSPLEYASDTEGAGDGSHVTSHVGSHVRPGARYSTGFHHQAAQQPVAALGLPQSGVAVSTAAMSINTQLSTAEVTAALNSLAAAVQVLDRKLTYLMSHMPLRDTSDTAANGHNGHNGHYGITLGGDGRSTGGMAAARQGAAPCVTWSLRGWFGGTGMPAGEAEYEQLPGSDVERQDVHEAVAGQGCNVRWLRVMGCVLLVLVCVGGLGWVVLQWLGWSLTSL